MYHSIIPIPTTIRGIAIIKRPMPDQPAGQVNRMRRHRADGKGVERGGKEGEEEDTQKQIRQSEFHGETFVINGVMRRLSEPCDEQGPS